MPIYQFGDPYTLERGKEQRAMKEAAFGPNTGRPSMTATAAAPVGLPSYAVPGLPALAAGAGDLAGTGSRSYDPAYGGIPFAPNPVATAGAATAGNVANLPGIMDLAGQVNQFTNQQAVAPYIANLPNYSGILSQASGNALDAVRGVLPQDVINNLATYGAERGAATGLAPGSPNINAAVMKALGLTTLDQQRSGLNQFGTLMGLTPTAPQLNPASMLVSPDQQQQAQWLANTLQGAPVPAAKAAADLAAALAGVNAGRGATAGGGIGAAAPSRTTGLPTYRPAPIAPGAVSQPGRADDPNATTSSYNPATWDQWMDEWEQGVNVPTAPGAETVNAGITPGFESLYPELQQNPDYTNWLPSSDDQWLEDFYSDWDQGV